MSLDKFLLDHFQSSAWVKWELYDFTYNFRYFLKLRVARLYTAFDASHYKKKKWDTRVAYQKNVKQYDTSSLKDFGPTVVNL